MAVNQQVAGATQIDVVDLGRLVWRYRYLVGAIGAVFTIAAIVFALLMTPIYRGEVTVTDASASGIGGAGGMANQIGGLASIVGINLGAGNNASREAQALLKSRRLVEEFVRRHEPLPALFPKAKKAPTLWSAVKYFQDSVVLIREDKREGTTKVAIDWTDPQTAAAWANEFVALANELVRARAIEDSQRNIEYLSKQIDQTSVVEVRKSLYNLIENETKTLMLANSRTQFAFAVADPAVPPEERIRPRRSIIVIIALFAGVLIGSLIALAHSAWRARKPA
ncbi:MAG TPA: Wzz/FepE/Etk N-terminal domain-containing protein [Steroidobacteraceae bacterium]|jgi:uncharacterized protein involved in exopolysaccharide biosynthesis